MSKRVRTLVLAGIAVLVLVALLVVLLLLPQDTEDSGDGTTSTTGSTVDTSVTLISKVTDSEEDEDAITVKEATFTTGDDSFTLVAEEDGEYLVKGYEKLPHNTTGSTVCEALLEIVADRLVVEVPETPADFGFDKEDAETTTVSVTYSDDSTFAFELGDEAPSGEGYYLREQGKAAIYLLSSYNAGSFLSDSLDFLSTSPITVPSADENATEDTVVVRDVELSGSVRPQAIFFQISDEQVAAGGISTTPSGYVIRKPFYRGVSMNSTLIEYSSFSSLYASDVAMALPTEADLKNFGFDDPYSVCTFNLAVQKTTTEEDDEGNETSTVSYYNVFKYTVKLGKENEDGLRYAIVYAENDLIPIVYLVDDSSIQWADAQYDDIADTMLFYLYIKDVSKMTITANGVTTAYQLTHVDGETDSDKSLIVTAGNTTYKASNFRTLYSSLMSLYRDGSVTEEITGDPALTLEIQTTDEDMAPTVIKLYRYSAGKYAAVHNTGETYLIGAKDMEALLSKYESFRAGNDISSY